MLYLIDTNVISELMRPSPSPAVLSWAKQQHGFYVSVITLDEIHYGLTLKSLIAKQQWLNAFIKKECRTLAVTEEIACHAGAIRGKLASEGKARTQSDILIAATAIAHKVPVATRNTADFTNTGALVLNPFII